ncbi:MAG: SecDF P1 head subdomain-containing protein [Acidobacteriota bacterium]
MRRCPTCSRVYDDMSLRFCFDDGTELVNKLPDSGAAVTAVLPASSDPVPTIKATPPEFAPHYQPPPPTRPAIGKKRPVWPWILGALLLIPLVAGAAIGGWMILHKRALTWHLVLEVDPAAPNREAAANQTVDVLKNRLNEFGVSNFKVAPLGNGRISVDLPAVENPERLKAIIVTAGKLELSHVISPPSPGIVQTYGNREEAIASLNSDGIIPSNRRVLPYTEQDDSAGPPSEKWVVVESPPIVDGSELRDASAVREEGDGDNYRIDFSLNKAGAAKFGAWTGANVNEYLGIVLNDEVKSTPYIKSQIFDQGQISGKFTKESAEDLALVLRAGALPATVKLVEERVDKQES